MDRRDLPDLARIRLKIEDVEEASRELQKLTAPTKAEKAQKETERPRKEPRG